MHHQCTWFVFGSLSDHDLWKEEQKNDMHFKCQVQGIVFGFQSITTRVFIISFCLWKKIGCRKLLLLSASDVE